MKPVLQPLPRSRPIRGVVIASPGGAFATGGMASVTRSMAEWLKASGLDTEVFIIDPRGKGPKWMFPVFLALSVLRLILIKARRRPEILHLQISERGSFLRKGLLLYAGKALSMRVVVHHHGAELIPFFEGAGRTTQRWVERIARGADLNIVLGDRWRAFLIQSVGVEPERVAVLFNATPKAGRPAEPRDPAAGGVCFLLLATLLPRKGISEFLQALSNLRREGLDVSAVLAGNGEIDRYRKEAALLGLADLCTFAGWVDRPGVDRVLTQADALVLPSYEEGLPMAILEALSASLPVVATRVGSIPEVLKDGETALLVEAKDVLQLTAAMRRIATDAGLRATLAKNGLALFSELFEMDPYMTKMLALYDKVNLASPRPVSSS